MSVTVRVRFNRLPAVARAMPDKVADCMQRAIYVGEAVAKANARVDTGYMRGAIHGQVDRGRTVVGWLISPASYSRHQEYGTRVMAGKAFMRPGADAALRELKRNLRLQGWTR